MTSWLIIAAALGLLAAPAWHFYKVRRRRRKRLQQRLLAGRSRLLGEEIAQRLRALREFDSQVPECLRREAGEALDQLRTRLLERQAHLQDGEDLIHLQQYKAALIAARSGDISPQERSRPAAPPPSPPSREILEEELLQKIGQVQRRKDPGREGKK